MSGSSPDTDQRNLERLLGAGHPCIAISTDEEAYAVELVRAAAMGRGHQLRLWSATRGVHGGVLEGSAAVERTEHPAAALYHFAHSLEEPTLCACLDLTGHLDDARTLRALREVIGAFRGTRHCLVLIDHRDDLPPVAAREAIRLTLLPPDEAELEDILKQTLRRLNRQSPIEARASRGDLRAIVCNLRGLSRTQAQQIIADCVADDRRFTASDLNTVLAHKRQRLHCDGVLEYIETPVDLARVGGMRRLKEWLERRRNALGEGARAFGIDPPRGVLLLGVQGSGKSLCAKTIAAAWKLPLLRLDPGTLYDRWVGESERRLRLALRQVEAMAPVVLWIDEIEKGFASAAAQSTDGGLSQRMFGTFLTWMQDHDAAVFLAATANTIEALPPELLRKGRFDEIFFVDLPEDDARREIFAIHLEKRRRKPGAFDLDALAAASGGYSGSEIEQAIVSGLHDAFAEGGELTTERILDALRSSPPLSVTMAERVAWMRRWAAGRCVPAD